MKSIYKICLAYFVGLAVIMLTARLGIWQWQRATEKSVRMAQYTEAMQHPPLVWQTNSLPKRYQRVILTGQWLLSQQILLDNRLENGQPGFHVLTPLLLTSADFNENKRYIVVVNRGWVAKLTQGLPLIAAPTIQTVIVRHEPLPRFFALQPDDAANAVWQNLDWSRYQKKIGSALQPLYTVALSDLGDGLKRHWPMPNLGEQRNLAYAVQWFGLSLLTGGLMLYFALQQYRQTRVRVRSDGH